VDITVAKKNQFLKDFCLDAAKIGFAETSRINEKENTAVLSTCCCIFYKSNNRQKNVLRKTEIQIAQASSYKEQQTTGKDCTEKDRRNSKFGFKEQQ
jgi:hypothetical protein